MMRCKDHVSLRQFGDGEALYLDSPTKVCSPSTLISALLSVILIIVWKTCLVLAMEAPPPDPAKDLLISLQRRFEGKDVIFRIGLWNIRESESSRQDGGQKRRELPPEQKIEVWTRNTKAEKILSLFVLAPEKEKGTAFHLHRWQKNGSALVERYMFLPAMDKLTRIKVGREFRLGPTLGGFFGNSLMGVGTNFKAETVAIENCQGLPCRRINIITEDGVSLEIWVDDTDDPVIRRAIILNQEGKAEVIMEINEIGNLNGRNFEISGLITIPRRVMTRFKIIETQLQDLYSEGPYTLESFVEHARETAKKVIP